MRIFVTGAKGNLGRQLVDLLQPHHAMIATDIEELDITNSRAVHQMVLDEQPELIIHCAAMTAVDECALHPAKAMTINGIGTKNLALAAQEANAAMLYVSSNEVFDGRNRGEYLEYDQTNPANPYGYSKWVGEQAIRDHLQRFYIVRTSWLFAHGGKNFIQTILRLAKSGNPLKVVVNEVAVPTYNDDLAAAIIKLIETEQYGMYHFVNEGRASRWTFARTILDMLGYTDIEIEKISAAEFARPSSPPEYSVLKNMMGASIGITLRPWEEALKAYFAREGQSV